MPNKQAYHGAAVGTSAGEVVVFTTTTPYVYDHPNTFIDGGHSGQGIGVTVSGILAFEDVGAGTTVLTVKCHQGVGTGGPQLGQSLDHSVSPSTAHIIPYHFLDPSRYPASGAIYTVSVESVGTIGNGNLRYFTVDVEGA